MQHSSIEEQMESDLLLKSKSRFKVKDRDQNRNRFGREEETDYVSVVNTAKDIIQNVFSLVKKYPNDQELGGVIREYINNQNIIK